MAKRKTKITAGLLEAQADATDAFLARQVRNHQRRFERSILKLEARILAEVKALKTARDGALLGAKVNLKQAQKVHARLAKLFETQYGRPARSVVQNFDTVIAWVEAEYGELNIARKFVDINEKAITRLKMATYQEFEALGIEFRNAVAKAMYDHVLTMAPFGDLVRAVSGALTGRLDKRGRSMTIYAEQYAFDATMNFHNSLNLMAAEEAGLDDFRYSGTVMGTTRDFCRKRAGKIFSRKTIKSWTHDWAGKAGPALTYRGGYNCRHQLKPVKAEWFPDQKLDPKLDIKSETVAAKKGKAA